VEIMQCPIQHNSWGSTTAIPSILGVAPDGRPQAELWAGAHPSAPSLVGGRPLDEVIAEDPLAALGPDVLERFGPALPFLAKILAAAEPLSIQAHPDKAHAEQGFAAEEAAGVPIDAPHRRYKDANHKPELLVALTPFHALAGFRPIDETMVLLEELDLATLHPFDRLATEGVAPVVAALLGTDEGREAAARIAEAAAALVAADPDTAAGPPSAVTEPVQAAAWWADHIARTYPGDPGVGVSLLLNLVDLEPGEGVNLRAGNVHAYLEGTGIEVMASSDNVLRGGLTPKYIDVPELLAVLDATPGEPPIVPAAPTDNGSFWPTPDPDFHLHMVRSTALPHELHVAGPRVAIVVEGAVTFTTSGREIDAPSGSAVWVPHADGPFRVRGDGVVFVAMVIP
jgi:mannose-6-phosphate isomerase